MKSPQSRLSESLFKPHHSEQPVRLIKAAQASKLLGGGHSHTSNLGTATEVHKKPEIRLVHAGADYCDLEVICGCGESTQVRCWNTPHSEEKGAL